MRNKRCIKMLVDENTKLRNQIELYQHLLNKANEIMLLTLAVSKHSANSS